MTKPAEIASTIHLDGREILDVRPPYDQIFGDVELDLGVAGSDEARQNGDLAFATIKRAMVRQAVREAQRLAIGTGLVVSVGEA